MIYIEYFDKLIQKSVCNTSSSIDYVINVLRFYTQFERNIYF